MDLSILYQLSYGVYLVGASDKGRPTGCIANTFVQVTNEPQTAALSLNKSNYTYDVVMREGRFSVSILSEDTNPAIISQFGFRSGRDYNKFDHCAHELLGGVPVMKETFCGALAYEVIGSQDMGTHVVIFGKLLDTAKGDRDNPMTYSYYHKVVKGKAPKTAPTYQAPEKKASGDYVCTVCGYVHKGDIGQEPDDYICPICSAPKSKFEPA